MARRAFYLSREMEEPAMINFLGCSAQGIAVANGVIALALLEHMVERKISERTPMCEQFSKAE